MSTRANVKIINKGQDKGVILYHHYDGYPTNLGIDLTEQLSKVWEGLQSDKVPYWWDAERVASNIIRNDKGYEVSVGLHGDIEYYYEVTLTEYGKFEIDIFSVPFLEKQVTKSDMKYLGHFYNDDEEKLEMLKGIEEEERLAYASTL